MNYDNTKSGNKDNNAMYEAFIKQAKVDGVDHICVGKSASTLIGRYAYMDKKKSFFIPNLGSFTSVNSFLSWMYTGNEDYRHKECHLGRFITNNNDLYKRASYFAKYHQLTAVTGLLIKDKDTLTLPWIEYTVYNTGIREYSRFKHRATVIKAMIEHIVSRSDVPFTCADFDYEKDRAKIVEFICNKFKVETLSPVEMKDEDSSKKKPFKKRFKKPLQTSEEPVVLITQPEEQLASEELLPSSEVSDNDTQVSEQN